MQETPGRGARRALPGLFIALAICPALACAGAAGGGSDPPEEHAEESVEHAEESVIPDTTIIAAQEALTPTVMAIDGVVGTAVGLCGNAPCIKVYLARDDEALRAEIPDTYRGFLVDTQVSGEFEARDDAP